MKISYDQREPGLIGEKDSSEKEFYQVKKPTIKRCN